MMQEGRKCLWCSNCPNYECYETEDVNEPKCGNTDCILFEVYKEEE